jgi:hypothetical protein
MNKRFSVGTVLVSLLWDVGLSVAAYLVARWLGASDVAALIAGSAVALLRTLYVAARARKVEVFSAVMLGVFLVGLALSLFTGDAKLMLAKESVATGLAGLAFVGSCFAGRPMIFHAARRLASGTPGGANELDEKWQRLPQMRRNFRTMSAVWGIGLLADAVVREPVIYTLSTSAAVAASSVLIIAVIIGLSAWNVWFVQRVQDRPAAP